MTQKRAFTLIELLVVLALIAILSALIYPVYQRATASGKAAACASNLQQLSIALHAYLNENDMKMPVLKAGRDSTNDNAPVIDNTFDKYAGDKRIFGCPADNANWYARTGTSYYWNVALNGQAVASLNFMNILIDATHIPVLSDKDGFHLYLDNKVNILYADGHATKDVSFFTGGSGN
jgi:prepilin-type N-terminal cleavage/methylation domain-containing protein/prepilin-type processing-associated H-X9-DG protein